MSRAQVPTSSRIIDISPSIGEQTAVWPGDLPFTRNILTRIEDDSPIYLSGMQTTVHIGAHADAPSHYQKNAPDIDAVDLAPYIGPCHVISVTSKDLVRVADITPLLSQQPQRVLLRTQTAPDSQHFNTDFAAIAPETIEALAAAGCVLIGIDTPSVDPFASKILPAHQALWRTGMRNLEGLNLKDVVDGIYELIALPLKLKGFDGSPVRAILRQH